MPGSRRLAVSTGFPKSRAPPRFDADVDRIVRVVATHFNIEPGELYGKERWKRYARARHAAMLIARESLGRSFPELGAAFGGRDHTTVMAACRRARRLYEADAHFRAVFDACERALLPAKSEGETA